MNEVEKPVVETGNPINPVQSDFNIGTFITVVTADKPRNKHYSLNEDGFIAKTTPDFYGKKVGKTTFIQDPAHFKQVHDEIGKQHGLFLILGYVEGTIDGEEFTILTKKELSKLTNTQEDDLKGLYQGDFDFKTFKQPKYCARLKNTFTQSNIFMFDRDEVDGMPDELIYPDIHSWWARMQEAYPMLKSAGYMIAKSNSGRILVDGKPYAENNEHIYCWAKDATDIERFGKASLIHAFNRDIGFMRPIAGGGQRPWSLFDPTVFIAGREVFDGCPTVEGEGLSITEANAQLFAGGMVDTASLPNPSKEIEKNSGLELNRLKNGSYTLTNNIGLTLDTLIESKKYGYEPKMLRDLLGLMKAGNNKHLRCETPFRPDSAERRSESAYIGFTTQGQLFLYDVGTTTTYHLQHLAKDLFKDVKGFTDGASQSVMEGEVELGLKSQMTELTKDSSPDDIKNILRCLDVDDALGTELELKKIVKTTGIPLRVLKDTMKDLNPKEFLGDNESQATSLINIGKSHDLFHDSNNEGYADCMINRVKCTVKIKSEEYRELLTLIFYNDKKVAVASNAINDAVNTLEALAKHEGGLERIAVRTNKTDDAVFIDLGDKKRTIIQVDKTGWSVTVDAPVKFVRKKGMTELPMPSFVDANLLLLKKHINIKPEDFPLIYAFMLCALAGVKPYLILVLNGEKGTGKSSTTRMIRSLVDPNTTPLLSCPEKMDDLLVASANTHLVVMDNLSGLKKDMADAICRLSTGGGIAKRKLHTDDGLHLVEIQKPVLLNGIDEVSSRSDLIERCLTVDLPVIDDTERIDEATCNAAFERDKAIIFTGLLNSIASGLKNLDSINLERKPRMADMVKFVTACEVSMDLKGDLIKAHSLNQLLASEGAIESSPVACALIGLIGEQDYLEMKPTELLTRLGCMVDDKIKNGNFWPKTPKKLNGILKRLSGDFRKVGIHIKKENFGNNLYKITKKS